MLLAVGEENGRKSLAKMGYIEPRVKEGDAILRIFRIRIAISTAPISYAASTFGRY